MKKILIISSMLFLFSFNSLFSMRPGEEKGVGEFKHLIQTLPDLAFDRPDYFQETVQALQVLQQIALANDLTYPERTRHAHLFWKLLRSVLQKWYNAGQQRYNLWSAKNSLLVQIYRNAFLYLLFLMLPENQFDSSDREIFDDPLMVSYKANRIKSNRLQPEFLGIGHRTKADVQRVLELDAQRKRMYGENTGLGQIVQRSLAAWDTQSRRQAKPRYTIPTDQAIYRQRGTELIKKLLAYAGLMTAGSPVAYKESLPLINELASLSLPKEFANDSSRNFNQKYWSIVRYVLNKWHEANSAYRSNRRDYRQSQRRTVYFHYYLYLLLSSLPNNMFNVDTLIEDTPLGDNWKDPIALEKALNKLLEAPNTILFVGPFHRHWPEDFISALDVMDMQIKSTLRDPMLNADQIISEAQRAAASN